MAAGCDPLKEHQTNPTRLNPRALPVVEVVLPETKEWRNWNASIPHSQLAPQKQALLADIPACSQTVDRLTKPRPQQVAVADAEFQVLAARSAGRPLSTAKPKTRGGPVPGSWSGLGSGSNQTKSLGGLPQSKAPIRIGADQKPRGYLGFLGAPRKPRKPTCNQKSKALPSGRTRSP